MLTDDVLRDIVKDGEINKWTAGGLASEVLDLRSKLDRVVGSGIWTLDAILKSCWHVLNPDSLLASHVREKIGELAGISVKKPGAGEPPVEKNTRWLCGRCEQERMIAEGQDVGEMIPGHSRHCPKHCMDFPPSQPPDCFPMPRHDGKPQCNCPFCVERLARFYRMEAEIAEALRLPGRKAEPHEALDYGVYLLVEFAADEGCTPEAVGRKMYECISKGFSRVDAVKGIVTGLIPVSRVAGACSPGVDYP